MNCRYIARDQPRVVIGRHGDDCPEDLGLIEVDTCPGCQPCTEPHCRVCGKEHALTCPLCVGSVRDDLAYIGRLVADLPEEVEHKGVESEAANLLGPAANPEAIGHMHASINAGRIPADYLEYADNDRHPLTVLGTWQMAYEGAFGMDESEAITVAGSVLWLTTMLPRAAAEVDVPFEDFAREVRESVAHLERVLHDGEQRETGAPCMDCRVPLVREWGKLVTADGWRCPRCRTFTSEDQYRLAVLHLHRESAAWLTAAEVTVLTGITPAALRKRVERKEAKSRRDSGRVVYAAESIPEVVAQRLTSA